MPDGKTPWTGKPTRDVDQFLQVVQQYLSWNNTPDIYMCMSRQGETKQGKNNALRSAKSQQQALALKSIYLDIDIKPPPKGYASLGEAITAVTEFCAATKIPLPTALVGSGGGLHCHWISDRALTPAEWKPYAEGLKQAALNFGLRCDAGVTGDSARVLRIPGTWNLKQEPRRSVKLLGMKEKDYDFSTEMASLSVISSSLPRSETSMLTGRPSQLLSHLPIESLAEGIGREQLPPLDWQPLIKQCGWFREALSTGGRDFSQGLWNLSTLAATFLEDGHELAHKMSKGHSTYRREETEELWDRKLAERKERGLGWPSCRAIHGEGSNACGTCPLLARGQSPLHLARVPAIQSMAKTVAATLAVSPTGTQRALVPLTNIDMPDNTFCVQNDIVHKIIEVKVKGDPPNYEYLPMFHNKIYSPWLQSFPDAINFTVSVDKGSYHDASIPLTKMTSFELESTLLDNRITPKSDQLKYMKDYMTSWIAKLQAAAAAHKNVPFGWHMNENVCDGFSYGSVLYKADGTKGPIGLIDPQLKAMYGPQGDIQPWLDAFKLITDQQRPGLETIVASSLGATLMFAAGQYSVTMAVWGESGAGKTSAARVACAIWGNPVLMKEVETATARSVIERLGKIKNLPFYWDEIKDEPAQRKAHTMLYVGTAGANGSRLNPDITQRDKLTWQTICGIFSNPPFSNFVLKENPETDAGLMRLVEWKEEVPDVIAPGQISHGDADRAFMALDSNFGQMGKQWAAFLGPNRELCYNAVMANGHYFEKEMFDPHRNTQSERFWIAFASAVQTAAELANAHLGLNFDTAAMRVFLVKTLKAQRIRAKEENVQGGSYDHTEDLLTGFLKANHKGTLHTETAPLIKPGKPVPVQIMSPPPMPFMPIHIHWIHNPPELRLSKRALRAWLNQDDVKGDMYAMFGGLTKHFYAKSSKMCLGAGTNLREPPETIITIPVTNPSPLWTMMTGKTEEVGATDDPGRQDQSQDQQST